MHKRVKVEFQDANGVKYTLAVEGRLSRDKVMKVIDLMNLIDGTPENLDQATPDPHTSFGRLLSLIEKSFSGGDFSSSDLAKQYEEAYNELIHLSTVSTYLSRLVDRGYLKRQRFSNSWIYRRVYLPTESIPR